ncbi:unnamed protein product [Linum trigynum]|uniref:Reticulon-like protein n=1 Tax=Linum trigynum TaxID=586398 RepID=A0AAV2E663_9ROSI
MTDAILDQLGSELVMQEVIAKQQTPLPPPIAADASYVDHDINLAASSDMSSNSSDSEIDNYIIMSQSAVGKHRLFGRQKPLHVVLGAGKRADLILWRNKQLSGSIFGGVTFVWLCFEWTGYHLVTFLCHSLILILATLFLSANLAAFINVSPIEFPRVDVSERFLTSTLLTLGAQLNCVVTTFRDVASGRDLKKFVKVIVSLWLLSVIGSWFSFLTLFYLVFATVLTVPLLYEKNEDAVDSYAEKAWVEIKKQYAVLDEKYLHKFPILSSIKAHKQH